MMLIPDNRTVWLLSDTHFFHSRIIEYCERPFSSVQEMNETMFNNWCETVADDDIVFFLGDFVMGVGLLKQQIFKELYDALPGEKYFLRGNHDEKITSVELIDGRYIISYKGKTITLCHFPSNEFDTDIYIHGHIHSKTFRRFDKEEGKNIFNVNVESIDYRPINLDEILAEVIVQ